MAHEILLGDFLRRRRSAIDAAAAGLPSYGQRRVPGLRREEVALLAGISTSYYTRIEQGAVTGVSASVLDAVARALQLDDEERLHLFRLARVPPPRPARSEERALHPRLELLLRNLDWMPAGVLGRDMGLRAWNRACHLVFADHLPFETPWTRPGVNWARLLFTDPRVASRFVDWHEVAMDLTGRLRASQSRDPADAALTETIDGLRRDSDDFARMWQEHPAREAPLGRVVVRHPRLGELHLSDALLRPTDADDELVLVFLPEPGTATEQLLHTARDGGAPRGTWPGPDVAPNAP